jgi:hypothetical protein
MPRERPARKRKLKDWTADSRNVSNSSASFMRIVRVMELMLRNVRIGDDLHMVARGIVAQLAHACELGPRRKVQR